MDPRPGLMSLLFRPAVPHDNIFDIIFDTFLACVFFGKSKYLDIGPKFDAMREVWVHYSPYALPRLRPVFERDFDFAQSILQDRSRFHFLCGMRKRVLLAYLLNEIRRIVHSASSPSKIPQTAPVLPCYRGQDPAAACTSPLLDIKSNKDIASTPE